MIDEKMKNALNEAGERISKILPGFYGKITFNFQNGKYVSLNMEQSIKPEKANKVQQ